MHPLRNMVSILLHPTSPGRTEWPGGGAVLEVTHSEYRLPKESLAPDRTPAWKELLLRRRWIPHLPHPFFNPRLGHPACKAPDLPPTTKSTAYKLDHSPSLPLDHSLNPRGATMMTITANPRRHEDPCLHLHQPLPPCDSTRESLLRQHLGLISLTPLLIPDALPGELQSFPEPCLPSACTHPKCLRRLPLHLPAPAPP